VRVGEAQPDIAGGFDMTRAPLQGQAQVGDVVWTKDKHHLSSAAGSVRFMNSDKTVGRQGNRGNVPGGYCGGDPEASSVLFAISSLREVQWEVVLASNSAYAQTNWSGELIRNTWHHVAVVNDPATATTALYIDGAPVLRNVAHPCSEFSHVQAHPLHGHGRACHLRLGPSRAVPGRRRHLQWRRLRHQLCRRRRHHAPVQPGPGRSVR
jgi:hypothetical protein